MFFDIDLGFHDEVTKRVFVETSWDTTAKKNLGINVQGSLARAALLLKP